MWQGYAEKMLASLGPPVQYQLPLGEQKVALNSLVGKPMKLEFTGRIACVHCGRAIKKTFNQGYCFPCFISLAQCDSCIIKPETCHFAQGTCREPEWGEAFCNQPHIVYLANSSGIKVGMTRLTQVPTRWLDQGAVQALPVVQVATRHLAGLIEVELARHVSDKTSWQQMLKSKPVPLDLAAARDALLAECQPVLRQLAAAYAHTPFIWLPEEKVLEIDYPVSVYPDKVKAFNFDKQSILEGVLQGIKGQYLLLDTGVINIRKFGGYELVLTAL